MSTPEGVDLPAFCCVESWAAARQAAWKARDLNCGCDPHVEYCDRCIPPAHRSGGAWDRCKPIVPASDRIRSLQQEVERLRAGIGEVAMRLSKDKDYRHRAAEALLALLPDCGSTVAPGGQPSEMSK